jgi:hypothetical protein
MLFKSQVIVCIFLFFVNFYSIAQKCSIETQGVYVADYKENVKLYLHFFGKDSVLATSSDMSEEEAKQTLIPNGKHNALRGKYNKKDCKVFVDAKNTKEKVKMEGVISGNTLKLTVTNLKDKSFEDFVFKFQR